MIWTAAWHPPQGEIRVEPPRIYSAAPLFVLGILGGRAGTCSRTLPVQSFSPENAHIFPACVASTGGKEPRSRYELSKSFSRSVQSPIRKSLNHIVHLCHGLP